MAEHNALNETIFSVLILGEKLSLIGLSNTVMVVFFLSGFNYPLSSP